jgi:hypothetical protein
MTRNKKLRSLEVLLSLLLGLPWYITFSSHWQIALFAHTLLAGGYLGLVLFMGSNAPVFQWTPFFVLSIACVIALQAQMPLR